MCVSPSLTSPSPSSTTSTSFNPTNRITSLSYSSSFPLSSPSTSPPPSYQSTILKLSAPLSSHKLLIVLSVAFGGLAVVLVCILIICYVRSRFCGREAPPVPSTASVVFTDRPSNNPQIYHYLHLHHHTKQHHHYRHLFFLNRETFIFMRLLQLTEL